jgi:hypothetical protein
MLPLTTRAPVTHGGFCSVKALVDRAGARGYQEMTGTWPGRRRLTYLQQEIGWVVRAAKRGPPGFGRCADASADLSRSG